MPYPRGPSRRCLCRQAAERSPGDDAGDMQPRPAQVAPVIRPQVIGCPPCSHRVLPGGRFRFERRDRQAGAQWPHPRTAILAAGSIDEYLHLRDRKGARNRGTVHTEAVLGVASRTQRHPPSHHACPGGVGAIPCGSTVRPHAMIDDRRTPNRRSVLDGPPVVDDAWLCVRVFAAPEGVFPVAALLGAVAIPGHTGPSAQPS